MTELREKALNELRGQKNFISYSHSKDEANDRYNRACDFAYAYWHINLIDFDTLTSYIQEFALAYTEVVK